MVMGLRRCYYRVRNRRSVWFLETGIEVCGGSNNVAAKWEGVIRGRRFL